MKIYPSKHSIVQTSDVDLTKDIPLAYIDTEAKEYNCIVRSKLDYDEIKPILPYQTFNSYDVSLFKPKKKGVIDSSSDFVKIDHADIVQRVGDVYQYIPISTTTFVPQEFDYSVVIKKNITYKTQENYNFKVGCLDDTTKKADQLLSKKLLKVFGDAPARGICPINTWVNNKDISANSLTNSKMDEIDFVFIQSKDGFTNKTYDYSTYGIVDKPIKFEKDFLSNHTNVWVCVDNFPITLENKEAVLKDSKLYSNVAINNSTFLNTNASNTTFTIETEDKETVKVHYLFSGAYSAAIVKEYVNKGFVIYTSKTFFDQIETNAKVLYEIMMYVYSNTYLESETVTQWITDTPPDYIIINNKLNTIEKFISSKQIHRFFDLSQNEVMFSKINISAKNVIMRGIVNDYITFEKLYTGAEHAKYADPPKPSSNMISVYTPQRQIMYFDEFVYSIQDNIEDCISWTREEDMIVFKIRSFKHTYGNVHISSEAINDIKIPLVTTIDYQQVPVENINFYIYSRDNILNYCEVTKYEDTMGTILAQVNIIRTDGDISVYDMRRRGGGLPENMKDNQELLDIGYIKGLAYRKSGAVVVTLPKRLEEHKELIENVIRKHMVAEKFPVILFEDNVLNKE